MRNVLEPIFGESGAIVAQFLVILIFVLILIGACYWLFRRYFSTSIVGTSRSRVPRLGIIDSLSIGHQHRLVLIRRDNVEHLLLLGKTTDVVVESSIARSVPAGARPRQGQSPRQQPQQRAAAPSPQALAPDPTATNRPQQQTPPPTPAPRPETTGISEPIPFPQNRRAQPRSAAQADSASETARSDVVAGESVPQRRTAAQSVPAAAAPVSVAAATGASVAPASAHFEEPTRASHAEPVFSLADVLDEIADEPIAARNSVEETPPESSPANPPSPEKRPEHVAPKAEDEVVEETAEAAKDEADVEVLTIATDDDAEESTEAQADDDESATTVSNLEQEMARLLGEITAKRDS